MKFLVKWTKEGNMKYVSHLDMMRIFQRALKRGGVKLQYSQGFSPHPKMSIAQPLSLGYTSVGEYLEIETMENFQEEEIARRLKSALPEGIDILFCGRLEKTKKASAIVAYGSYEIEVLFQGQKDIKCLIQSVEAFAKADEIPVEKLQKKSGKLQIVDIKEMIQSFTLSEMKGKTILKTTIKTGSQAHLNPDLLLEAFRRFLTNPEEEIDFSVHRTELFAETKEGALLPLYQLK